MFSLIVFAVVMDREGVLVMLADVDDPAVGEMELTDSFDEESGARVFVSVADELAA